MGLVIPWAYPKTGGGRQAGGGRQRAGGCRRLAGRRQQAAADVPSSVASHQSTLLVGGYLGSVSGRRGCGIASIVPRRWWLLGICFWVQRVWHRINRPSSLVATWDLFLGADGVASHQSSLVVGGYLVSVSGRRGCGIASITKKYCMGSLVQNCESGCLGVGYA